MRTIETARSGRATAVEEEKEVDAGILNSFSEHFRLELLTHLLGKNRIVLIGVVAISEWLLYFLVYFMSASWYVMNFGDETIAGADPLAVLSTAQTVAHAIGKWVAIQFVSTLPQKNRVGVLTICLVLVWIGSLVTTILPGAGKIVGLAVIGLATAPVWSLAMAFADDRSYSPLVAGVMSISMFCGPEVADDMAATFVAQGWSTYLAPFLVATVGVALVWIPVLVLASLPKPDATDLAVRHEGQTSRMSWARTRQMLTESWVPLALLVLPTIPLEVVDDFTIWFWDEICRGFGVDSEARLWGYFDLLVMCVIAALCVFVGLGKSKVTQFIPVLAVQMLALTILYVAAVVAEHGRLGGKAFLVMEKAIFLVSVLPAWSVGLGPWLHGSGVQCSAMWLINVSDALAWTVDAFFSIAMYWPTGGDHFSQYFVLIEAVSVVTVVATYAMLLWFARRYCYAS